ncbi:hypothetical protein [Nonomuraea sp. NPDC049784]|uniref:hypothetical protein n=1 Tax=Nonomuraea sp. NPDC049784 TaxID=3154361 RepID=UPI003406204C
METVARVLVVLAWLSSSQVAAGVAGVSGELGLVVPVAVLLSSALVPFLQMGARPVPVVLTVTSAWLLAARTWGEGWASTLVASAAGIVVWLTWDGSGMR